MVGEGGAAGDGRGNAVPKKSIGVYYILRITVYLRLIFLGRSRAPPPKWLPISNKAFVGRGC